MGNLDGKNAIVTGANRGVGKALVDKLSAEGCNIWAFMRKEHDEFKVFSQSLENRDGTIIKSIYADLSDEDNVKSAFKNIYAEKRNIDILINNAGIAHMGLFQMTSSEFIRQLYAVNVFAPMLMSQLALNNMRKNKSGKIINVASTAANEIFEGNSIYGSSKAALVAFTQSLAAETFKYGVTVNAIAPGLINTDMSSVFEGKNPDKPISHTALGRKIEPDEIASIVVNLLRDEMKIINGAVITINGGHKL